MELLLLFVVITCCGFASSNIGNDESQDLLENSVNIGKCCSLNEILVDDICTLLSDINSTETWQPEFVDEKIPNGFKHLKKYPYKYKLRIGLPKCQESEHQWHVYNSREDILAMLPSGKLRHYVNKRWPGESEENFHEHYDDDDLYDDVTIEPFYVDYAFGQYCIDKAVLTKNKMNATYAMICVPPVSWTDIDYLIKRIINPATRAVALASYLLVAIVYFVLPQLKDLVGNMITSMSLCLVVHQIASTITIYKEYANHFSFLAADAVAFTALLAAFLWLNALGYFVWNTFRSRNVFLTVTDGRKYCYYSTYVWGTTATITGTAMFANFALEVSGTPVEGTGFKTELQETIGWLARSVYFMSIAFTIIIDLCFVLSTSKTVKRMSTYGRIHHKLKYSFRMFTLLYVIISFGWLSLMISLLNYDHLVYFHIIVNIFQALFVLYVCVFGQKRVRFLLSKTCNCCDSGTATPDGLEWGEEMTAINAGY